MVVFWTETKGFDTERRHEHGQQLTRNGATRTTLLSGHPKEGTSGPTPLLSSPSGVDFWWASLQSSCPGPFWDTERHERNERNTNTKKHDETIPALPWHEEGDGKKKKGRGGEGRGGADVGPLVVYKLDSELDSPLADTPSESVFQGRFVKRGILKFAEADFAPLLFSSPEA